MFAAIDTTVVREVPLAEERAARHVGAAQALFVPVHVGRHYAVGSRCGLAAALAWWAEQHGAALGAEVRVTRAGHGTFIVKHAVIFGSRG